MPLSLQRNVFFSKTKPSAEEVKAIEENALQGLETLIGDGNFAIGDTLTLADLCLLAHISLVINVSESPKKVVQGPWVRLSFSW